jgi:hypothetical protein
MQNVSVQIIRFVDSSFPGWVECELFDADVTNGRDGYKLTSFSKLKGKFRMKRIAVLTLLVGLAVGWSMPIEAQDTSVSQSDRQTDKLAQKQQNALYKHQKKQEKAQEKAQRTADKQQRKAVKKYEKQQRKLLKNANLPAKHTP